MEKLARRAGQHAIALVGRGNDLTTHHKEALEALVGTIADMLRGKTKGRYAVGAQTGFGKSTAIRAMILALHELAQDDRHGLMVCSSRVETLLAMRRELIEEVTLLGLDVGQEELRRRVGVLHGYAHDPRRCDPSALPKGHASEPSIWHEDTGRYPFLFVTHARMQSGEPLEACMKYRGQRRVVLFDESFFSAAGVGLRFRSLRGAIRGVLALADKEKAPFSGLRAAEDAVREALDELRETGKGECNLVLPELGCTPETALAHVRATLQERLSDSLRRYIEHFAGHEVRLLAGAESGESLLQFRQLVHPDIQTILVTDASYPTRTLCHLDDSLQEGEAVLPRFRRLRSSLSALKSWERVTFHRMNVSGGRSFLQAAYWKARDAGEICWVSREVAKVIERHPGEAILLATYKHREDGWDRRLRRPELDLRRALRGDLVKLLGENEVDGVVEVDGQPHLRLLWLTFGEHEGSNDYRKCSVAVLHGVLLRDREELKATALGQLNDIEADVNDKLADLRQSEAAHVVAQTASRCACREVVGGVAKPSHVYLLHKSRNLREHVERMTPGANWKVWRTPVDGLSQKKQAGIQRKAAGQVAAALQSLREEGIEDVSTRRLKGLARLTQLLPSTYRNTVDLALSEGLVGDWCRFGGWLRRGEARAGAEREQAVALGLL